MSTDVSEESRGSACFLLLAGFLLGSLFDSKIEAVSAFETSVDFYRTTTPEDNILHS
jgi:hypothetical protein